MGDEEFGGADESLDGGKSGGGKLKLIIIIAVAIVVIGIGGFFAGKFFMGSKGTKEEAKKTDTEKKGEVTEKKDSGEQKEGEKAKEKEGGESKEGAPAENKGGMEGTGKGLLPLELFTANLADPLGRRYVEAEFKLVLNKKELLPQIKDNELIISQIRNVILMTLSSKMYSELATVAGKMTLFQEIQMRVNEVFKQEMNIEPVVDVLQTKFIMQ